MCGLLISIITVVHRGPASAPLPVPDSWSSDCSICLFASLPLAFCRSLYFSVFSSEILQASFSPPLANLWSVYGSSQVARKSREGKERCLLSTSTSTSTSTSPLFLSNFYCLPVHLPPGVLRHPRSSLTPHHSSTTSFCLAWRPEAFNLHHLPSCRNTARVPLHLPTYFTTSACQVPTAHGVPSSRYLRRKKKGGGHHNIPAPLFYRSLKRSSSSLGPGNPLRPVLTAAPRPPLRLSVSRSTHHPRHLSPQLVCPLRRRPSRHSGYPGQPRQH
ncbi:hypothetical protein K456DRAFT_1525758 [Colletotrichum gloeosporioides 23]|nr:hypothetical protein K456DRAFT_1525758 [Colletotrichum gloeosporioides 23]